MLRVVENELLAVPQDWCRTVRSLCSEKRGLKAWFETQRPDCVIFVGDRTTKAFGHWSERTFGLVSDKLVYGFSEEEVLELSKPEGVEGSRVLGLFLSRKGGSKRSVEALEKIATWSSDFSSFSLSSQKGELTKRVDRQFLLEPSEHTGTLTFTPTRFLVACMTICSIVSQRETLSKRAELLANWYSGPSQSLLFELAASLSREVAICAPSRLHAHCVSLAWLLEEELGQHCPILETRDLQSPVSGRLIFGIPAKATEESDLESFAALEKAGHSIVAFSSHKSKTLDRQIKLSRRTTDIGRNIHAALVLQHIFLYRKSYLASSRNKIVSVGEEKLAKL